MKCPEPKACTEFIEVPPVGNRYKKYNLPAPWPTIQGGPDADTRVTRTGIERFTMQITRQADYAIRAVLYVSKLGSNQRAATKQIAQEQHIPASFLAKIISQLSIAGLLQTTRGARGGVMLAKAPEAITVLDVVEAIDGPIALNECVNDENACHFGQDCPLRPVWCDAQDDLVKRLKGTNFAHLISLS
jgi:Rrf2 family protein